MSKLDLQNGIHESLSWRPKIEIKPKKKYEAEFAQS